MTANKRNSWFDYRNHRILIQLFWFCLLFLRQNGFSLTSSVSPVWWGTFSNWPRIKVSEIDWMGVARRYPSPGRNEDDSCPTHLPDLRREVLQTKHKITMSRKHQNKQDDSEASERKFSSVPQSADLRQSCCCIIFHCYAFRRANRNPLHCTTFMWARMQKSWISLDGNYHCCTKTSPSLTLIFIPESMPPFSTFLTCKQTHPRNNVTVQLIPFPC